MLLFVLCDSVSSGTELSSYSFLFSGITDNDTNFDKSSSSQTILHAIVSNVFALVSFLLGLCSCYQRVARVYLVTLNAPCSSDRRNRLSPTYMSLIIVSQCGEMYRPSEVARTRLAATRRQARWNCPETGPGMFCIILFPGTTWVMLACASMFGEIVITMKHNANVRCWLLALSTDAIMQVSNILFINLVSNIISSPFTLYQPSD